MRFLDPLQAYRCAVGNMYIQMAFAVCMTYLIIRGDFDLDSHNHSILYTLCSHYLCYGIDFVRMIQKKAFHGSGRRLAYPLGFINAALYQLAIYYAQAQYFRNYQTLKAGYQLKDQKAMSTKPDDDPQICGMSYSWMHVPQEGETLSNFEKIQANINASEWLLLEITFYYISVFLTIIFLFTQHLFKVQPTHQDDDEMKVFGMCEGGLGNETVQYVDAQKNLTKNSSIKDQDILSVYHFLLQEQLVLGTVFLESIFVIVFVYFKSGDEEVISDFQYSIWIRASLNFIGYVLITVYAFSRFRMKKILIYFLRANFFLQIMVFIFMIVQLFVVEESHYKRFFEYWILILICMEFSYLLTSLFQFIIVKVRDSNYMDIEKRKSQKLLESHQLREDTLKEGDEDDYIEFDEDFYSVTFVSLYKKSLQKTEKLLASQDSINEDPYENPVKTVAQKNLENMKAVPPVTEIEIAKCISNCVFIFVIQMGVMGLLYWEEIDSKFEVYTGNFQMFLARILCAILLHMQMEGEIRRSMTMFNCARHNIPSKNQNNRFPMFMVALLQFSAAIVVELFNIYLICQQNKIESIVLNYIALGFIAEIDNLYAKTLYKNKIKESICNGDVKIIIDKQHNKYFDVIRWYYPSTFIYRIMEIFYGSYYYYFMPFTIIILNTVYGSICKPDPSED
ncbi:UNKNOWN [Stylonychia lemnae]|uniref:Transmembrane protein n=1 Tax=Stylonychia lemnae TaxID=5949 RepID=A0A078AKM6_STYLE|nr:UNKNOWN [Stylonychia lemnae]|eukprot:CDW81368.1 UNKNOWN [Stylonychia lemnae]